MTRPLEFKPRTRPARETDVELDECENCEVTFSIDELRRTEDDVLLCGECYADCPVVDDDEGWDEAEG